MIAELERAFEAEIERDGLQAPLPDDPSQGHGPNDLPDIYVQSRGSFVVADGPAELEAQSSWMGLHNNFSDVIPGVPAEVLLRDTIPHELLHMIQCGYDCGEPDAMVGEGTAVWMADRVYEGTPDDIGVTLEWTSLVHPELPMDGSGGGFGPDSTTGNGSGSWLFFRFLSEQLGGDGSAPGIVKEIWEALSEPGTFTLDAIDAVAMGHGSNFAELFGDYGVANYTPEDSYEQGGQYVQQVESRDLPLHPHSAKHKLAKGKSVSGEVQIDHLAMSYVAFTPAKKTKKAKLSLTVDVDTATSPVVRALVVKRSGSFTVVDLEPLVVRKVAFDRRKVQRVVLVLVNASTRFECGATNEPTPCNGVSLDDDIPFAYEASARR
jgi:hypothetical protein